MKTTKFRGQFAFGNRVSLCSLRVRLKRDKKMGINLNLKSKLDNFDMEIAFKSDARRIGILGESGAGKSMLLKYLAGIYSPLFGEIEVDDICVFSSSKKMNIKPQDRNIAYLFQSYALFPTMTVEDNIKIIARGGRKEKNSKTQYLLKKFHIENLAKRYPAELSGGQQQRVSLARIMAYEPKLILLDEPFSALDENLKERLQIDLEEMIGDFGGTVILVSHNRDEIYRFSQELLIINNGRSVEHGSTEEIFSRPQTIEGAKMVGITNLVPARVVAPKTVEIPSWNFKFEMDEDIQREVNYVGFRDTDLELVWESEDCEEFLDISITNIFNRVKEKKIYFKVEGSDESEFSLILTSKEEEKYPKKKIPTRIKINKRKLVLLHHNAPRGTVK